MQTMNSQMFVEEHRIRISEPAHRSRRARIDALNRLEEALVTHREALLAALKSDLGKPEMESYPAELAPVIHEIRFARRRLGRWMKSRKTGFAVRRFISPEPFGAALIIGPWNYPVQLTLVPLVSALAAGNAVTVKPSEQAPRTAEVIRGMLESAFEPAQVRAVLGDAETAKNLIDAGYDKVFFTGSPDVGALVAERAARQHSDVTLELGGKSPAIAAQDSDILFAARRIAWGKFLNAGQTCIAPDYLLVQESIRDEMVQAIRNSLLDFYGKNPASNPDYARIVNRRHFDRITGLMAGASILHGGQTDRNALYIEPTLIDADMDSPAMKAEIFGPVLPVVPWRTFEDIRHIIGKNPNPLALYLFTRNRKFRDRILSEIPFGGGAVNDTILQVSDVRIPFGGRGSSGQGSYHGYWGFAAFSHFKGIRSVRQGRAGSLRFPPYRPIPERIRKMVFGL